MMSEENDKKILELNNKIDNEKSKIKKMNDIIDEMASLTKSMNKCIDLLAKSIGGKKVQVMLNDMYDNNNLSQRNIVSDLECKIENSQKTISELSQQKEDVLKQKKDDKDADSTN